MGRGLETTTSTLHNTNLAMVSTPKRRRFQAPITSFFTRESSSSDTGSNPQQARAYPEALSSPPLPEEIQSSLLTVGMRIRKSVPEGYKTHKTLHSSRLYNHSRDSLNFTTQTASSSTTHGGYAELVPLCGLHKIGGMAVQPMPAASSGTYGYLGGERRAEQAEEPDPWSVPSSQQSADSFAPPAISNKRAFTSDQDEDDDDDLGNDVLSQERSTYPFSHTRMPDLNTLFPSPTAQPFLNNSTGTPRAFAIPRSRFSSSKDKKPALEGQENLGQGSKALGMLAAVTNALDREIDFEDADFLAAKEDADVDNMMDEY